MVGRDATCIQHKAQSQEQRHGGGMIQHVSSVRHGSRNKEILGAQHNMYPVKDTVPGTNTWWGRMQHVSSVRHSPRNKDMVGYDTTCIQCNTVPGTRTCWGHDATCIQCKTQSQEQRDSGSPRNKDMVGEGCNMYPVYDTVLETKT